MEARKIRSKKVCLDIIFLGTIEHSPYVKKSEFVFWTKRLRYILLAVGCVCLGSLILAVCLSLLGVDVSFWWFLLTKLCNVARWIIETLGVFVVFFLGSLKIKIVRRPQAWTHESFFFVQTSKRGSLSVGQHGHGTWWPSIYSLAFSIG